MRRLDRFRRRVNRALALGPLGDFDMPVFPEGDPCLVVVALEDEPISVVLNRLQAVGGHANLIVGGGSEVRIVSVTGIHDGAQARGPDTGSEITERGATQSP